MPNQLHENQQTGMFAGDDLSASEVASPWKATFLAEQKDKKNVSAAGAAQKPPTSASPLPQEWPDENGDKPKEVKPLKLVKCTRTECDKDLHCFRLTKKQASQKKPGECRDCDAAPIDFARIRQRNLADAEYTFASLKKEWIRYEYWTREFDPRAIRYAKRKGMRVLLGIVEERIRTAIGKPVSQNSKFDGQQTSWEGNPLHYAQHATATCCRKCLEIWHGIPQDSEITPEQLSYLSSLVKMYLEERLIGHDIRPHPVKVAPMKPQDSATLPINF